MYIKILLNYIFGYVNVQIEGFFVERLVNICISKKIFLWNIKRSNPSIATANVGIKAFKKLVKVAKETKCRVKIKTKKGLPFTFNKYKKRKIFFLFLFILILFVISLSNFIWNIEIIGNNAIPKEELIEELKKDGLSIGKLKHNINTKEIVNQIRLDRNDLAWIGIEIKGTNAIVKVVEADKKPEIIDENDFCNIVATKPRNYCKSKCYKWYTPSEGR